MAGEWIKVRAALPRDPRVMKMAEALRKCGGTTDDVNESVTLRVTVCVTVVALQTVWCMADEVGKADGNDVVITGVNAEHLTHSLDLPGFADAMKDVGWLVEDSGGVRFPNLLKYNVLRDSSSAKNAERQRRYRERKAAEETTPPPPTQPPIVRNVTSNVTRNVTPLLSSPVLSSSSSESSVGGVGEVKETPFDLFWKAWPNHKRKTDRKACLGYWTKSKLDAEGEAIVRSLTRWKRSEAWTDEGGAYIPLPLTWLRGERWKEKPKYAEAFAPPSAEALAFAQELIDQKAIAEGMVDPRKEKANEAK